MAVGITDNAPSAPPLEALNTTTDLHHVNFIVALDSNRNSVPIPAKKTSINGSESLRRIINEKINCDTKGNHIINNVDEFEFRQLIDFLENKKLPFKDQNHRLQMFAIAKQFNCPELQIYCICEVDANLNISNVITVYRSLWFYGSLTSHMDAIDRKIKNNIKKNSCTPDEYLTFLVFNVLQFICMNAENVLLSEEIDNLSFKEFENIVKQEDLLLRSEMVLINALSRWSREECRRKNIELTHENERTVLCGELCYAPRYLTLKPCEFELACKNVRFLDPSEINLIREAFDGKTSILTAEQSNMLNEFRKPRPKYARMPIHLSARSHHKNYSRRMRRNDRTENEASSCFLDFLACFICLCD